ncbi:MAG: thioredoxin-like domain-containing protein, partial [Planctomycetota bacterium]
MSYRLCLLWLFLFFGASVSAQDAADESSKSETKSEDAAPVENPEEARFKHLVGEIRKHIENVDPRNFEIPDFQKGKDWFNSPPLSFSKELKGKIVILDFWTYCCINCIHILPDLAQLETKYAGQPVAFIGVHSKKFANEGESENIRHAVLRYEIDHPVVNDDEMFIWRQIGVRSWPTLAVVGPKGNLLLMASGEGNKDVIDATIQAALDYYPAEIFRHDPLPHTPEAKKVEKTPLRYPGKLAVDAAKKRKPVEYTFCGSSNYRTL